MATQLDDDGVRGQLTIPQVDGATCADIRQRCPLPPKKSMTRRVVTL